MTANFSLNELMGPMIGSTFLSQLGLASLVSLYESLLSYLFLLIVQFGPFGIILGILGFRKVLKDKDWTLRKINSLFIVFTLFGIFYRVTDQFTFFIASYVFWAILMSIGSVYAFRLIPEKMRLLLLVILALLLFTTPIFYNALPHLAERFGLNDAAIGIPKIGTGIRNSLAYYITDVTQP